MMTRGFHGVLWLGVAGLLVYLSLLGPNLAKGDFLAK